MKIGRQLSEVIVEAKTVAEVEAWHEKRYNKLAKNIEDNSVFKKDTKVLWKCRVCGRVHEGLEAPKKCPTCLNSMSYFELYCENY